MLTDRLLLIGASILVAAISNSHSGASFHHHSQRNLQNHRLRLFRRIMLIVARPLGRHRGKVLLEILVVARRQTGLHSPRDQSIGVRLRLRRPATVDIVHLDTMIDGS